MFLSSTLYFRLEFTKYFQLHYLEVKNPIEIWNFSFEEREALNSNRVT